MLLEDDQLMGLALALSMSLRGVQEMAQQVTVGGRKKRSLLAGSIASGPAGHSVSRE